MIMSVLRRARERLRPPARGRAGLARASRVTARISGAAAVGALMLVPVLAATANAAPASAPRTAHASTAHASTGRASATPAHGIHIDPVTQKGARAASSSLAADVETSGPVPYQGGPVQHDPTFYAIFWLPSGTSYEPGIVNGDSGYEGLMSRYLKDAGSTNLANVASQYYDTTNGFIDHISPATQYGGAWTDTTSYPESPVLDSDIQAAVNAALVANPGWNDGVNSTFFVFTGYGITSCVDSSESNCSPGLPGAGYCAYHGHFDDDTRGHTAVYANMPELESWNAHDFGEGCQSTNALPNGDIYADNEFSVLSHEQWEAETDPLGNAWTYPDNADGEIADLCQGQYGYEPYFGPSNTDVNGDLYVLQELWSNADNGCAGAEAGGSGFNAVYGPYAATAGSDTGTLNLAQTDSLPSVNVILTPNPTIDWGDGTTSSPGGDTGCIACTLTGDHTYAYDSSATYPITYKVTVTYNTGCCISYTQTLHIIVFQPLDNPLLIIPNDATMTYGGTVPVFTERFLGLLNGNTSGVVQGLTCTATGIR